jgi:hypothetical protein
MVLLFLEDWWGLLSSTEKVFWGISLIFSVLFLIQFVVSLIGLDFDTDVDVEVDTHGEYHLDPSFTILSVRSIIAFFTFFGWTGVLVLNSGGSVWAALGFSSLAGLAAMFIVGYIIFLFTKLTEEGNVNLSKALYTTGEVYLSIPANKNGQGKVHLKIQGALKEVDAVTNGDTLPTGSTIKVVEIIDDNLILVEQADYFLKV